MSQCPTASATPSTVLDSQPSGLLDATPYFPVASTVWQSQELPLSQLTPRLSKEGWIWTPKKKERRLAVPSTGKAQKMEELHCPIHGSIGVKGIYVPAAPEGEEDIGVLPQEGRRFRCKGKCYLLTYARYIKSEETRETSCHEVIKESSSYSEKWGNSLLEYAMGVTESHDLREGRFAPLSAYEYLKKEADAWEARYGTLTEEFLLGQCPAGLRPRPIFAYAMEAEDAEGFFGRLKERQPDMAMGYNNLKAFTGYFYRDKGALPQGVCEPKALKINLPPGVQEWVTSNILERDPESDRGKILFCGVPQRQGNQPLLVLGAPH
ncbi:hypothetical protein RHS01_09321 [Rhizoctonia solani]|uniref:Uncharacterized protein n=1 Tax=Rhizoctonia solani TaxID=456999 RepID=A0A8H7I7Q7_9AGAM|nr:hypothetical protein RHS01_09321 [Rhizoctonia solani]